MRQSHSLLPPSDLEGKRAVIVEDEGIVLLQLKIALRRHGLEVVGEASTGAEAIEVVLATRPDIILLDINLPVINGFDASRRILEEYPVCIVIVSGRGLCLAVLLLCLICVCAGRAVIPTLRVGRLQKH